MSVLPSPYNSLGAVLHGVITVCVVVCVTILLIDGKVDPTAGIAVLASIGGVSGVAGAASVLRPNQ